MKTNNNLKVRVIISTRLTKSEFLQNSQTAKSIKYFIDTSPVQVKCYYENNIGLSEIYNKEINEAGYSSVILVFMHDDILIADYFWTKKVRDGLDQFSIVGLIGNQKRHPYQPSWRFLDLNFKVDKFDNYSGVVGHGTRFPPKILSNFGTPLKKCKIIDGLFIAVDSRTLLKTGLRFDERFKFNFYDIDFCRSAENLGLDIGTIPLSVVHESPGNFGDDWKNSYKIYINKWKE